MVTFIEGVNWLYQNYRAIYNCSYGGADFTRIQCTPDMLPADIGR